jgi:hypothetical protein
MKYLIFILLIISSTACNNKKLIVSGTDLYSVDTLGSTLTFYKSNPFTGIAKNYQQDSLLTMELEYEDGKIFSQKYFSYYDNFPSKPIKEKIVYDKLGAGKKIEYTVSGDEKATVNYDSSGKVISYTCSGKPITTDETYEALIGTWIQIEENRQPGTKFIFFAQERTGKGHDFEFIAYKDDGTPIATLSNAWGNYSVDEPGVVNCYSMSTPNTKVHFVDCRRIVVRGNIILEKQ